MPTLSRTLGCTLVAALLLATAPHLPAPISETESPTPMPERSAKPRPKPSLRPKPKSTANASATGSEKGQPRLSGEVKQQLGIPNVDGKRYVRKVDGLVILLHQNGSKISTSAEKAGYRAQLTGQWDPKRNAFVCRITRQRERDGSLTVMLGYLSDLGSQGIRLEIVSNDGKSDLPPNYYENYVWFPVQ
jgi:hypothetical protein